MKVRAHLYISGGVQGVFFRANTRNKARELGVRGWVKNLPDGKVEVVAEGEKEKVEELIEWCWKGPKFAEVENVQVEYGNYTGEFEGFEVRY
jgi:acylphosphatase